MLHFNLILNKSSKNSIAATYTITKVNFSTPLFYYISLYQPTLHHFFPWVLLNFASYNITHEIYIRSFSRNSRLNKLPHQQCSWLSQNFLLFHSCLKYNFPLLLFCLKKKKSSFSLFEVPNNENTYTSIILPHINN